jgi:UDP-glucose 4-epimerase
MRAIVTGAAGFIGSNLVDRLLADGHQVVGIDNLHTGITANLDRAYSFNDRWPRRFTLVRCDIQAPELGGIVAGASPHVIFHLAAQVDPAVSVSDPLFDARCNVLGTINICEAGRRAGVRRIVYAASGESRYGAPGPLPVDESSCVDPLSPHAAAKLAGEMYLRAYAEIYGLAPICLALAYVYGPRQHPHGAGGVIAGLGQAMITGRPFVVYRDGATTHDYVYVDDVVDAFVRAGRAPVETTGTFNIGTGQHTTVTEVHDLMAAVLDGLSLPNPVADFGAESHAVALTATKARNELGWNPKVELAEGIRRTLSWLCDALEPKSTALKGA